MEILYAIAAILLLIYPESSAEAATVACTAMKTVVVKSLFPMMVLSRLLAHSRLSPRVCDRIARTLFWRRLNLSNLLLPCVLAGYLSGLPVTAIETEKLVSSGKITKKEGAKAIALSSLPSPAFVILAVSPSLKMGLIRYGILVVTAYISALFFKSQKSNGREQTEKLTFSKALSSSTVSALSVAANIVFFSSLTCCLSAVIPIKNLLAVFFEMSSAVMFAKGNQLLLSLAIGWCGLSALSQIKTFAPSVSVIPYAVTRCISCAVLLFLHFFGEFLQNTL